jgi:surfeit locus 1 family protein
MTRSRPFLWPTLISVPAVLVLLGLGSWQLERLAWKEALIAERQARAAAPPAPLPPEVQGLAAYEYRSVTVEGRFLHQDEIYLVGRSLNGNAGYHVITPLERGDGGGLVLVNRGWVPYERKAPDARVEAQLAAPVTIGGVVRTSDRQRLFVPDNDTGANVWFWRDLAGMAAHLGRDVQPVIIDAGPAPNPGGFPIGGQNPLDLPNNHLSYAITWFSLALACAVIYVLYLRRSRRRAAA